MAMDLKSSCIITLIMIRFFLLLAVPASNSSKGSEEKCNKVDNFVPNFNDVVGRLIGKGNTTYIRPHFFFIGWLHEFETDGENVKDFGKNVCDVFDQELNKYAFEMLLGHKVCLAKQNSDKKLFVAMKFILHSIIPREILADKAEVWKKIEHPNIVRLLDCFHSSRGFCPVIEYASQGNLSNLLKKKDALSKEVLTTEKVQMITVQLLEALGYLQYSRKIVHGNLKPQNILIFAGDVIKICDYGLAPIMGKTFKDHQHINGTTRYMSPETLQLNVFTYGSDLWAVGMISSELSGSTMPNDSHGASTASVAAWHIKLFYGNEPLIRRLRESDLGKLLSRLLQKNPADRSLDWPEFPSEASNDVQAMDDRPLRTNSTAGVGACDIAARLEGVQPQDLNESTSSHMDTEFKKALAILRSPNHKMLWNIEDVRILNHSLDAISEVVDADAFASTRVLNEIFWALKDFTIQFTVVSKPDYYGLLVKYLFVVAKILQKLWYIQTAADCTGEARLARIERELSACYINHISRVVQEAPEEIIHLSRVPQEAHICVIIHTLLSCLATISKSYEVDMHEFLPVACEASNAIWSLLTAESLDQLNVEGEECKQIVHAVTKALILREDQAVRYAFYICLLNGSQDTQKSVIQIILTCCMYDNSTGDKIWHLPSSSSRVTEVVSRGAGGDGTILSLIFDLLSSYATDRERVPINERVYLVNFISYLCSVLATIAQYLCSPRRTSAESMLTSSREVQRARLSLLANLSSITTFAMYALASIFSLESSKNSSFSEIALPLIPKSTTLCENLRAVLTEDGIESKLSTLQACMDGVVGLLMARLKWDMDSTIQQFYDDDILEILIDLVGGNIHSSDNQIGLSRVGVLWTLKLIHCRGDSASTIFKLSCTKKYIKFMSGLISDAYLELIKRWGGCGRRKYRFGCIVYAVTHLLESPFGALEDERGNEIKADSILEDTMQTYIERLLEVGIPGQVVKCLKDVRLKDAAGPVAFLARITHHRSVVAQVLDKGLLQPSLMKKLLGISKEVTLHIVKIVSDIATMDKAYYEHIEKADILPDLQKFLTHEDPEMRMHVAAFCAICACIATTSMVCWQIAAAPLHGDSLHEELGKWIPQLMKSLLSAEERYNTKSIACCILRNLVSRSGKLSQDIISNEAIIMEALIFLVESCLLDPGNEPEDDKMSLPDISIETLEALCEHSSAYYPQIERGGCIEATESKNPSDRSLDLPEFLSETSNYVQAGVEACDIAALLEGVQLQDLNESNTSSHMDAKFKKALDILHSPNYKMLSNIEDARTLNHSLDTISEVVDAVAFDTTTMLLLKKFFLALKDFTIQFTVEFKPDYYGILVKYLSVVTKILQKLRCNRNYWSCYLNFFREAAADCTGEGKLARIERELSACYINHLSRVVQEAPEEIIHLSRVPQEAHIGVIIYRLLSSCLEIISKSFEVDMLEFLPVACEASNTISSVLLTVESLDQLNVEGGEECKKIVHVVTEAFRRDQAVRYAFYICLRNGSQDTQISVIQIILRCSMYDNSTGDKLCHFPASASRVTEVVSRGEGGDGTILSLIFDLLSSYATDRERVPINERVYLVNFISYLCLVLATIAQSLCSPRSTSAESMLTSSREVQRARLSLLAHLSSITPFAMFALASIFSLESSRNSSFSEIALPLIPESITLCENLRAVLTGDGIESKLSTLQACMDGVVGLLMARLKWDMDSTIQQFCDDNILEILIDLVGGNIHSSYNQIGLSPVGVVWILKLLIHCRGDSTSTIFKLSCTKKYIKFMFGLISDAHLELIKHWGGRKSRFRHILYAVTRLLESPFGALEDERGNGIKADRILENMKQTYIERLLEVGIPGQVVKCLKDVKLKDAAGPVAFLARITHHRSVVAQVLDKGLLQPSLMKKLLGISKEVTLNIVKIVSDIATMDKVYNEHIERADILPDLQKFLTNEDPEMCMHVCSILCQMCLHSDYFYGLLIAAAPLHGDSLHEELGKWIPQLMKSLLSAEERYNTKSIACCILRNLVSRSGKLSQDIISNEAIIMEALIFLVESCLLDPGNQPEDNKMSLLDMSIETLEALCQHSSAHYPQIERGGCIEATESKVAASVSQPVKKIVGFSAACISYISNNIVKQVNIFVAGVCSFFLK